MEPKEHEKCDKRKRHTNNKLHMIYISSDNVRHSVTKTFTTFHFRLSRHA